MLLGWADVHREPIKGGCQVSIQGKCGSFLFRCVGVIIFLIVTVFFLFNYSMTCIYLNILNNIKLNNAHLIILFHQTQLYRYISNFSVIVIMTRTVHIFLSTYVLSLQLITTVTSFGLEEILSFHRHLFHIQGSSELSSMLCHFEWKTGRFLQRPPENYRHHKHVGCSEVETKHRQRTERSRH